MKNRIGEKHITNEGYTIEIIKRLDSVYYTVIFQDGSISSKAYKHIKSGAVRHLNHKTVHGVGYIGYGIHLASINGKSTRPYTVWKHMLGRSYDNNYHNIFPTYIECSVVEEWHCFQVFAEWYEKNYKEHFVLDKDILSKGNKVYGPDTCVFVPSEINALFVKCNKSRGHLPVGVSIKGNKFVAQIHGNKNRTHLGCFDTPELAFIAYKTAKEAYIKEIANKYKDTITIECYNALMNYEVEITD